MPASFFRLTFLVLVHSACYFVFLPRHWLLRSLATATVAVAPEVFAIFCLAIQFFWHQRHGVKRRCHSKRVSSSQVALPPPISSSSVSRLPTLSDSPPTFFLSCLITWLLENAGSQLSPFLFIVSTLNLCWAVAKSDFTEASSLVAGLLCLVTTGTKQKVSRTLNALCPPLPPTPV